MVLHEDESVEISVSGLIVPGHLASAIFRLLVANSQLWEYEALVPELCSTLQYFQGTWIVVCFYMSVNSILFR